MSRSESPTESFKQTLEPFLEMLEHKEKTLSRRDWIDLVNFTKDRILNAPDQYLPGVYKPSEEISIAIENIFKERLN